MIAEISFFGALAVIAWVYIGYPVVLGVAAIFIWIQPMLGLLVLLPMLLVGMLLTRYNYRVRPVYRAARKRLGDLSALFADNMGGMRVIQSFAQARRMAAEARVANVRWLVLPAEEVTPALGRFRLVTIAQALGEPPSRCVPGSGP